MLKSLRMINTGIFISCMIATSWMFASVSQADEKQTGFDPKSVVFVTNRDSSDVTVIDMNTDVILDRIACGDWSNPHMAVATLDGKYLLATGTNSNFVAIIDLETRETTKVRLGLMPEHFDITPDGKYAYIGNMGVGAVSVVDIEGKKEIRRIAGFFEPHGIVCLPDSSKVYVSNMGAHEVAVIDAEKQLLAKRMEVGSAFVMARVDMDNKISEIVGIANPTLTIDGRYAYAADGDSNQVAVIDTIDDSIVATIPVGDDPWRAYASPDGTKMVVPNNGDQTVSVIDTKSNKVIATFPGGEDMTGVNFVNGGKKAYVISRGEHSVYVIDMEKMKELKRIKLGLDVSPETASTTPDGKKVYLAASRRDSVYVFDADTDNYKEIPNVGLSPWAVTIIGGANYCH
ncbi:MAG: putative hydrazine hydrolase C subunit [Candidatus Scalindua rubra]|uniref:Putative hydrazine hydrolase C subunit n=1 Tax=Candidatus Scalindua rubra TaxID=1872076 RepID=A0A1E3X674_9BACT|nr:MAG: putative hydrazine hydrolase C subunit [Candidatus Scalindua rubra]